MPLEELDCPACGAPVAEPVGRCVYCGSSLRDLALAAGSRAAASEADGSWGLASLAPGEGEFGWGGRGALAAILGVATLVYAAGWPLEDFRYWLDPRAIAVWGAALPLTLLAGALFLRGPGRWLPVALFCLTLGAVHVAVMTLARGRMNDDYLGIAALYAGGALAAWTLGRVLHYALRLRRARSAAAAESQ